jgi:hypothetical protein
VAAERLTDAQVQQIRRRRQAGELLCALAEEHQVSTRNLRRRLDATATAAAKRERRAGQAEPQRVGRQGEQPIAVASANRRPLPPQPHAAASALPLPEPGADGARASGGPRRQGTGSAAEDERALAKQQGPLPLGFKSWQQRLDHYQQRQLDSYAAWLDYHDALHGRETPAERRARQATVARSAR